MYVAFLSPFSFSAVPVPGAGTVTAGGIVAVDVTVDVTVYVTVDVTVDVTVGVTVYVTVDVTANVTVYVTVCATIDVTATVTAMVTHEVVVVRRSLAVCFFCLNRPWERGVGEGRGRGEGGGVRSGDGGQPWYDAA